MNKYPPLIATRRGLACPFFCALILWTAEFAVFAAETGIKKITFEGKKSEHRWTLKELNPRLPADWSSYNYLVMEFKPSTPQRFELWLYTADGKRKLNIKPLGQNVWTRASMPLAFFKGRDQKGFDLASAHNRPGTAVFMNISGPFGPLNAVKGLGVTMADPVANPTLEIRSVQVAKDDPGSDVLDKLPVVDEFGQWIPAEWQGKIKDLEQLQKDWAEEEQKLAGQKFNYCKYGGYMATKADATGFFRVQEIDGRWWFVDPDGHLFFSTGVNCIGSASATPTAGREKFFAALPPEDLLRPSRPASSRTAAQTSGRPRFRGASFYTWNLLRRFGKDSWREKWLDMTLRRMDAWGLNTIGNWSDQRFYSLGKKPYVVTLRGWGLETGYLGLPDVYSEEWTKKVDDAAAEQCTPRNDDPYLLGYFIGNEPPWPGRESDLVGMILSGADTPMQRELKAFLQQGDTPKRRKEFVLNSFEKMLNTINAAVRKYDPNHLNLGIRFGGHVSDEVARMGRLFDVYSLNIYSYEPTAEIKRAYKIAARPVIIGEFHIGAPGNGLSAGLVQARNQKQRGVAYTYYAQQAAALPETIGLHWFQWLDQPVTGRMDGENYNIGYIDVTDRPYWDFIDGVKATHKRLLDVHTGKQPPTTQTPLVQ